MSATLNLSLTAQLPTNFVKLWDNSSIHKKAELLLFIDRVNCCNKDVIIPRVSGHIYLSRSPVVFKVSAGNNNNKSFEITSLREDGYTFSGKTSVVEIYNYDKAGELLKAVVRSFPPKTFEWMYYLMTMRICILSYINTTH